MAVDMQGDDRPAIHAFPIHTSHVDAIQAHALRVHGLRKEFERATRLASEASPSADDPGKAAGLPPHLRAIPAPIEDTALRLAATRGQP